MDANMKQANRILSFYLLSLLSLPLPPSESHPSTGVPLVTKPNECFTYFPASPIGLLTPSTWILRPW